MNTSKTLLALLVAYLPENGGWPKKVTRIGQDYDRELMFYGRGNVRTGIFLNELAIDHRKCGEAGVKITREQYEAALAASKELRPYQVSTGHYTSDAGAGKTASAADADGWIEWAGGECPVDSDAIVEVKYLKPSPLHFNNDRAGDFSWSHTGSNGDIIAYRIVQPNESQTAGIVVPRDTAILNDDQLESDMNECEARDEILYELANFAATTKTSLDIGVATEIAIWLSGKGYRKQ
ncbi:conserved phage protein [Escherichia phage vB_EcoM_ECO1230-10]|uniref:Conserved phage protein n=1 Tax=Escherichia phage vB_EcoM_ECO1230-10 TaxID=669875 RepID=D5LGY0_9CAUD|nr:conserved phage protein [Escherichia phage vB_EcoM_ECO1230-10]ADE87911.1 conserved phage protein [Escherichia phage vB_EcoM_ECO1230-10]